MGQKSSNSGTLAKMSDTQSETVFKRQIEEAPEPNTKKAKIHSALSTKFIRLDEIVSNPGLQHVAWQIFSKLDPKSLGRARLVSKSWKFCIESDKYWWRQWLKKSMDTIRRTYKPLRYDQIGEFVQAMMYIEENEPLAELKPFALFMNDYCKTMKIVWIDPFQFSPTCESPVHVAADRHRWDILRILDRAPIQLKLNVKSWKLFNEPNMSLLTEACAKNQVEVLNFFMNLKSDKSIKFKDTTLFHKACRCNSDQAVKLFLNRAEDLEIDLNLRDWQNMTAMMYARSKMVMQLLLSDHRINAGATDHNGRTALHHVCRSYYLRSDTDGVNCTKEDARKFEEQILSTIRLMLSSTKIHLTKDSEGDTPLHDVCYFDTFERRAEVIFNFAMERGIDVNLKNNDGETPAHSAFSNPYGCFRSPPKMRLDKNIDMVLKYAKKVGLNLEAQDNHGRTPLHCLCARMTSSQVTTFLQLAQKKYGIEFDLDATDNNGKTPMDLCPKSQIPVNPFFSRKG